MKPWLIIAMMLGAAMLVGCGVSGENVENTRAFLDALNTGDVDAARQYVCEDDAEGIMQGLSSVGPDERQTWAMQNINCRAQGDDVQCDYQIIQEMEDNTTEQNKMSVIFNIEDGKICGFEMTSTDAD